MDIYVKPYIYPATDSFKEIRVYKFFRKVGPRKYELLPGYEGWGFSSKAKAEKRAREEEERIRKEEEAQLEQEETCTGCENGCDQCIDPLMAGYAGCYHKDSEKCNCAEEYRLHQKWIYSAEPTEAEMIQTFEL